MASGRLSGPSTGSRRRSGRVRPSPSGRGRKWSGSVRRPTAACLRRLPAGAAGSRPSPARAADTETFCSFSWCCAHFLSIIIPAAPICNPGNAEDIVSDSFACEVFGHVTVSAARQRGHLCAHTKNDPRPLGRGTFAKRGFTACTARCRPVRGSRWRTAGSCRPACR